MNPLTGLLSSFFGGEPPMAMAYPFIHLCAKNIGRARLILAEQLAFFVHHWLIHPAKSLFKKRVV